ncbi:ABC transporter substrate-binding protein [Candidatus Caldatribacterium sp.]|uniref:ABC transporter substrate-binding protein n=1 Tax=Candidatus Caldatribacterium sp. TaxID=2282143 RepID=UPI002991C028|nr:ABC transporter substrate-binding protein [Candidatus Caldatribacterium sp.]MDW8082151.1 ABC transporter substrate-binding protein [Candidatus Calescibacterium sp.]
MRRLGITLVVCVLLWSFGAVAQEKITLQFWHTYSLAEIKVLTEQVERYMRENPNVQIQLTNIPFEQRATMIINAIKGGTPPDLYRGDMPMQFEIARLDAALPLEDYIKKFDPEMLSDVPKNIWDMCTYKGQIIAIPEDFFVPVIYYNKDLFQKAGIASFPTTWEALIEAAKKLHKPGEGVFGIEWMSWGDGPYWSTGALFLSNGGNFVEDGKVVFASENNAKTFAFLRELFAYTPPGLSTFGYDDWDKAFYLGKVGIQLGNGSWSIGNYRELAPNLNYGIAPYNIVGPMGTEPVVPGHGVCFYMVMKGTKHPEEAAKVITWLVSPENHLEWCQKLWHTPVRTSTFADAFFNDPRFDAFKFELNRARAIFTGDVATVFNPLIADTFRRVFWDIIEGGADIQQTLESGAREMEKILAELGK